MGGYTYSDCKEPFFEWFKSFAVDQDEEDRSVIVVFHNLKGLTRCFCYNISGTHDPNKDTSCAVLKALEIFSRRSLFKFPTLYINHDPSVAQQGYCEGTICQMNILNHKKPTVSS